MADERHPGEPGVPDPEQARIDELIDRVHANRATDAEREELALYIAERPELEQRVRERPPVTDGAWLARVDADRRLAAAESTPRVKAERGLGVGLTIAGFALSPISPILSLLGLAGGVGLLIWSFTRVRLTTYKDDPYRDIDQ